MKQLLGLVQNNPFSLAPWTSVHTYSCLYGSLFGHLFRMLNIPRHNHIFSSYREKMWLLNNWYFQSSLKALSGPRINVLLEGRNQRHVEKWWPFGFSNKHSSERPSKASGDFTVIHSNGTHLYKYQYLSFNKRPTFFKGGDQKSALVHLYIDCCVLLIKMV